VFVLRQKAAKNRLTPQLDLDANLIARVTSGNRATSNRSGSSTGNNTCPRRLLRMQTSIIKSITPCCAMVGTVMAPPFRQSS